LFDLSADPGKGWGRRFALLTFKTDFAFIILSVLNGRNEIANQQQRPVRHHHGRRARRTVLAGKVRF